jgi:hypothetical protein
VVSKKVDLYSGNGQAAGLQGHPKNLPAAAAAMHSRAGSQVYEIIYFGIAAITAAAHLP